MTRDNLPGFDAYLMRRAEEHMQKILGDDEEISHDPFEDYDPCANFDNVTYVNSNGSIAEE